MGEGGLGRIICRGGEDGYEDEDSSPCKRFMEGQIAYPLLNALMSDEIRIFF